MAIASGRIWWEILKMGTLVKCEIGLIAAIILLLFGCSDDDDALQLNDTNDQLIDEVVQIIDRQYVCNSDSDCVAVLGCCGSVLARHRLLGNLECPEGLGCAGAPAGVIFCYDAVCEELLCQVKFNLDRCRSEFCARQSPPFSNDSCDQFICNFVSQTPEMCE